MIENMITGIVIAVMGLIISFVVWSLKKTIIEKMDLIVTKMEHLEGRFTNFELEVTKDYVRKEDFTGNTTAHEKLWNELNSVRERVARIEK